MKFKITKHNWIIVDWWFREKLEKLEDWNYYIEIEKIRNKASWSQFKYYRWAIVPFIWEQMGEIFEWIPKALIADICDNIHEMLLDIFSEKKSFVNKFDKRKRVKYIHRTSEMNSKEFTNYIDSIIIKFKNDYNWVIPRPDDNRALEFYDEQIMKYWLYF